MTAEAEAPPVLPQPDLLERGRYAISQMSNGSLAIVRATPICERCQSCGCGDQQEPIEIPAMVVPFITGQAELTMAGAMKMMRGFGNGK